MSQSRLLVLLGVLVVAIAFGFYRYDLQPKADEVAALEARVAAAQVATAAAQADVTAGREALAGRARDAAKMTRAGRAVPDDLDQPSLVFQINAIARRSGVSVVGVSLLAEGGAAAAAAPSSPTEPAPTTPLPPGAVAGSNGFAAQPLELEFRGTYGQLTTFTRRLHELVQPSGDDLRVRGRLIDVSGMALEPAKSGFPQIVSTLTVTTYLAPGGSALAASVAPSATTGTATPTTATQEATP